MLNSKEIIPIKPDHHLRKENSSTMMLKMFTALVVIGSIGAKYYLVEAKGDSNAYIIYCSGLYDLNNPPCYANIHTRYSSSSS